MYLLQSRLSCWFPVGRQVANGGKETHWILGTKEGGEGERMWKGGVERIKEEGREGMVKVIEE